MGPGLIFSLYFVNRPPEKRQFCLFKETSVCLRVWGLPSVEMEVGSIFNTRHHLHQLPSESVPPQPPTPNTHRTDNGLRLCAGSGKAASKGRKSIRISRTRGTGLYANEWKPSRTFYNKKRLLNITEGFHKVSSPYFWFVLYRLNLEAILAIILSLTASQCSYLKAAVK